MSLARDFKNITIHNSACDLVTFYFLRYNPIFKFFIYKFHNILRAHVACSDFNLSYN